MSKRKHAKAIEVIEDQLDLNPLIDVITMLIIFFIMGGKLTQDLRTEQITVPPTKTAAKLEVEKGWDLIIVNVFGNTQVQKGSASTHIRVGTHDFVSNGIDDFKAYSGLRTLLNRAYDRADKYADTKGTGMMLPKVTLEIRADADTQYRVIQEIQQVVCDSIDPDNKMTPTTKAAKDLKPFVSINFTSRLPFKPQ